MGGRRQLGVSAALTWLRKPRTTHIKISAESLLDGLNISLKIENYEYEMMKRLTRPWGSRQMRVEKSHT